MTTQIFQSITMLRFGKKNISKEEFYDEKKSIKTQDVNVYNF